MFTKKDIEEIYIEEDREETMRIERDRFETLRELEEERNEQNYSCSNLKYCADDFEFDDSLSSENIREIWESYCEPCNFRKEQ